MNSQAPFVSGNRAGFKLSVPFSQKAMLRRTAAPMRQRRQGDRRAAERRKCQRKSADTSEEDLLRSPWIAAKPRTRGHFGHESGESLKLGDWLADDAVCREPLSVLRFPDQQGKYREFRDFRMLYWAQYGPEARIYKDFFSKFPTQRNRAFQKPNREFFAQIKELSGPSRETVPSRLRMQNSSVFALVGVLSMHRQFLRRTSMKGLKVSQHQQWVLLAGLGVEVDAD